MLLKQIIEWCRQSLLNNQNLKSYLEPIIQWFMPTWFAHEFLAKLVWIRLESENVYTLVLHPEKKWQGLSAGQHFCRLVNMAFVHLISSLVVVKDD
ncbi:MAG: hypothetical protein COW84_04650 [Gammaproteobacteria bacterium CG22_combo_CG10-13_8_21_14_all_40_8]|nr:MAG: hypothetical protein COW84_04650 [Gammaproteobacteria bacterium CG22_combo_CG10-13_8_21_14_all_40_8]